MTPEKELKTPKWLYDLIPSGRSVSTTTVLVSNVKTEGFQDPPMGIDPATDREVNGCVERIVKAPNGTQERTLNDESHRVGKIVGAGAIGFKTAFERLYQAGMKMESHIQHKPWQDWYVRHKVTRAITQGIPKPDPGIAIHERFRKLGLNGNTLAVPPKGRDIPYTDLGNAERLMFRYSHRFRYCPALSKTEAGSWMVYNGAYWEPDKKMAIIEAAKAIVRAIETHEPPNVTYKKNKDGTDSKEVVKDHRATWAKQSESETRIKAMVRLAASAFPFPLSADKFDQQPFLFNCSNVTIRLGANQPRQHDYNDLLTQCSDVKYKPNATCPKWVQFLLDCMNNDLELVEFLQVWIGYCLTGRTNEHKLVIHWGHGTNGKTTFHNVIAKLFGTYAETAAASAFMQTPRGSSDNATNDIAALRSARHVNVTEANEDQYIDEALIKRVSGGDSVTARLLFREFFTFDPQFKISMATNHMPNIKGVDLGIWRRIYRVPWKVTFGAEGSPKINYNLADELLTELSGILNWALEGCEKWHEKGLAAYEPEAVRVSTAEYRHEQDVIKPFIDECCEIHKDRAVAKRELYVAYTKWDGTARPLGKIKFNKLITSKGYEVKKHAGLDTWHGIALNEEGAKLGYEFYQP